MFHTFINLFDEGGWVLYPLYFVSVIVWYHGISKFLMLRRYSKARLQLLSVFDGAASIKSLSEHPAEFKILAEKLASSQQKSLRQRACSEFIGAAEPRIKNSISTISACAVMAPLLGLLGTIGGMNNIFTVIGIFGFGNPTILSSGVSLALRAPLTGLGVAIVALFVYDYIQRSKTKLLDNFNTDLERLSEGEEADTKTDKGDNMQFAKHRLVSDETERPEINLAPFVDTLMVLLIFFVVTANLTIETGVDVTKPKALSAKPTGQTSILVGITREGTIHVFGRQVNIDRLKLIVERETGKQPDVSVVIIADREADVGRAVEVMDNCALAGAQKVSLAASKGGQP